MTCRNRHIMEPKMWEHLMVLREEVVIHKKMARMSHRDEYVKKSEEARAQPPPPMLRECRAEWCHSVEVQGTLPSEP